MNRVTTLSTLMPGIPKPAIILITAYARLPPSRTAILIRDFLVDWLVAFQDPYDPAQYLAYKAGTCYYGTYTMLTSDHTTLIQLSTRELKVASLIHCMRRNYELECSFFHHN